MDDPFIIEDEASQAENKDLMKKVFKKTRKVLTTKKFDCQSQKLASLAMLRKKSRKQIK